MQELPQKHETDLDRVLYESNEKLLVNSISRYRKRKNVLLEIDKAVCKKMAKMVTGREAIKKCRQHGE